MARLLVTGGAGYVGSHTVRRLLEADHSVIVVDDLSEGHQAAIGNAELVRLNLASPQCPARLDTLFSEHPIDAVLHFAARAYVGESVRDPELYYRNNVVGGLQLLSAMARAGIPRFVFSSTCATYGVPEAVPIPETHPQRPVNPYGRTKLILEMALEDYASAIDLGFVTLRYFNAAGAHPDGTLGEVHAPETHLIPLALDAASGGGESLRIFGRDYDTPDGTCVRDYIHVVDLADAHVKALDYLGAGGESRSFNLGTGRGHSVLEVIEQVRAVVGAKVAHDDAPRRPGDPPVLVADPRLANEVLAWQPRLPDLKTIVETAWEFRRRNRGGYHASGAGRDEVSHG